MNLPSPDALDTVLAACGLLALWVGWAKVVGPRLKRGWGRLVGTFQAIAGRDPVVDKVTGKEVAPAIPPLGEQLSSINDTMAKLVLVIESNQDAHLRLDHHDRVIGGHDKAISALIAGSAERAATALSSAALLSAVANREDLDDIEDGE